MAAVNRKTDVKQKEADVNQKLQLYGIYSGKTSSSKPSFRGLWLIHHSIAFANGKVPSVSSPNCPYIDKWLIRDYLEQANRYRLELRLSLEASFSTVL